MIDYKEFLKNLGTSTDTVKEKSTENEVPGKCSEKQWKLGYFSSFQLYQSEYFC